MNVNLFHTYGCHRQSWKCFSFALISKGPIKCCDSPCVWKRVIFFAFTKEAEMTYCSPVTELESMLYKIKENKTGVINDPLSDEPTISPVANIFSLEICFVLKSGDGRTDVQTDIRTDDMSKNNYHYRPLLWVPHGSKDRLILKLFWFSVLTTKPVEKFVPLSMGSMK